MTHDPLARFREAAERVVKGALGKLGVSDPQAAFDDPPEGMGDLAFPCFALSKTLKRSPAQIAQELAAACGSAPEVSSTKAAGPYVNFTFDGRMLAAATLEAVLRLGPAYGSHPPSGKRVLLEHTSANPTDRLHVGRGRNPIIGDTLARALRLTGCEVETQYYVDDMGRQAAMRLMAERHGKTYQWAAGLAEPDSADPDAGKGRAELDAIIKGAESGDAKVIAELQAICTKVMEENISPVLRTIRAEPDTYASESRFVVDGSVQRALEALRASGKCGVEEDGALYIDLAPHGVSGRSSKFFLARADGTSLYPARDVAYHLWKNGQCDRAINILGEDHKTESKGVAVSLKILGEERVPDVLFYSFVSLPEGKMSTRKGRVVFLDDLVDEAIERAGEEVLKRRPELADARKGEIARAVGVAAVRYNIVRTQPEKQMVFKWEEALNFEGNSAPFIQYAHARACSILAKAGEAAAYDPSALSHEMELKLVRRLAAFPSLVAKCARDMTPHLLASYAFLLASDFNQFYRDCPVLAADEPVKGARLALTKASRSALCAALEVLAIEPLEEM